MREERERERERERQRGKKEEIAVNQKFVIIDNDFCGISSLSALRKLDVPIIAHLWNQRKKTSRTCKTRKTRKHRDKQATKEPTRKKSDKKRKQQRKNMREKRFLPSILNQGGREKEPNFSLIVTTLFAL